MQIAMIGLGKMGSNLAQNLNNKGHQVFGYDVSAEGRAAAKGLGVDVFDSLATLCSSMTDSPRVVWLMVPSGNITTAAVEELSGLLAPGDILIEGGNSNYKDSVKRYAFCKEKGIRFMDVGTSGGTSGANQGACLMIGGDKDVYDLVQPVFHDIAIADGYLYAGGPGSGHFLKMIHNGVEYGMMQSIAEGFDLVAKSGYDYDLEKVAKVWNNGSVIRGWLMELMESAFGKDPRLEAIRGVMHSSGEAKWTIEEALDSEVCSPVIALSLMMRYRSLEQDAFAGKVVAALRNEFGGHTVVKAEK